MRTFKQINKSKYLQLALLVLGFIGSTCALSDQESKVNQADAITKADKELLKEKPPLRAREEDDRMVFKVLQLADLHYSGNPDLTCREAPTGMEDKCKESWSTDFIKELLKEEKPDFVVFTGDNMEAEEPGNNATKAEKEKITEEAKKYGIKAMDIFNEQVEENEIPWAMVFGNHDDQQGFSRERIFEANKNKKHSYTQSGPEDVDGVGNYQLTVHAPGNKTDNVLRMYFFDTHRYADGGYDSVHKNQVKYYQQMSRSHEDDKVSAMMFFHIPIPEYDEKKYPGGAVNGLRGEVVHAPKENPQLFKALKERGEVKATFAGHDHSNEYCRELDGIQLCYGGGTGFGHAYGQEGEARRARVIEWSMDKKTKKETITSWKRHFGDVKNKQSEETLYESSGSS